MKVAIMQPTYLPWVGYFQLIDAVDQFIFLDDVQLTKRSWQVRNRIKTPQGELYLSVPVEKAPRSTLLHAARVKNALDWRTRHLQNIQQHYAKAPFFEDVFPALHAALEKEVSSLVESNIEIIQALSALLGVGADCVRSSTLRDRSAGKGDGLLELCALQGATAYLSPLGSAAYLEADESSAAFERAGVALTYQNYTPAPYTQRYGEFVPYLSVIDLLLNEGATAAQAIMRAGAGTPLTSAQVRERLA